MCVCLCVCQCTVVKAQWRTYIGGVLAHNGELDEVTQANIDAIVRLVQFLYIGELKWEFLVASAAFQP